MQFVKSPHLIFGFFFLALLLSGCDLTVYRALEHREFSIQYPNWEDYTLEKYEDNTFKIVTTDKKEACEVMVVAYTANYLTVTQLILEIIEADKEHSLIDKHITSNMATLNYLNANPL